MSTKGKTIAITGKGGSGKTTLAAILTSILAKNQNHKVLSIDADSSINLPYALGVEPKQTVAEIRRQIIENPESRTEMKNKPMQNVMEDALEIGDGFGLLVMGRPEGPGCFCAINNLLRYGIDNLSKQFDITLIDCEAGPEQVNRRVVDHVDVLIIVTDASIRGARVAGSIMEVIQNDKSIQPGCTGLVINRLKGEDKLIREKAAQWGLEIFGTIPEDEHIAKYDAVGKPIIDITEPSSGISAIEEISETVLKKIA